MNRMLIARSVAKVFPGISLVVLLLSGCDKVREWEEQVQLHDSRVIIVQRTVINDPSWGNPEAGPYGVFKEARLKLRDPVAVEWRGDIPPLALDVNGNQVYVVIALRGGGHCLRYGNPNPPFVYFRSIAGGAWERVEPEKVPSKMRQNLLIYPWVPEVAALRRPLDIDMKRKLNIGVDPEILNFDPMNKRRARLC